MSTSIVIAAAASAELNLVAMSPDSVLAGTPKSGGKILTRSADGSATVWVWECTVGTFTWHYNGDETAAILSGEAFISTGQGEEKRLGRGDMAFFPGGSSATWRVTKPIKKIAITRKVLPFALGSIVRVCHKLIEIVTLRMPNRVEAPRVVRARVNVDSYASRTQ